MTVLASILAEQRQLQYPHPHLLGNFVDNHDGDRFLFNHSGDEAILRNGLSWTMLYHGLPIIYYGAPLCLFVGPCLQYLRLCGLDSSGLVYSYSLVRSVMALPGLSVIFRQDMLRYA